MSLQFSFIIPVYNRPDEVLELLKSMQSLNYTHDFEVVIVEDGSSEPSEEVVKTFHKNLTISYYKKSNTGPGDSRNFGMRKAKGNYFLILDSDVILPKNYLLEVEKGLSNQYTDCFGGPDDADKTFTEQQKAINYAMTSILTTGGIRGKKASGQSFEPRSFNMGLSKKAFESSGGFGDIHPGEDPDLSIRLKKSGFKTQLLPKAKVFHKRRINWALFYKQVNKFGLVRPILTKWHPASEKITYWFPLCFCLGLLFSFGLLLLGWPYFILFYGAYFFSILVHASLLNNSLKIGLLSCWAAAIQFYGYGIGFVVSTLYIRVLGKPERQTFPKLFFK